MTTHPGKDDTRSEEASQAPTLFVRSCPNPTTYQHFKAGDVESFSPALIWKDWKDLHNELRNRVLRIAANRIVAVSSEKYRGSLERGIDVRQVLRSMQSGQPTLYVRRSRKTNSSTAKPRGIVPIVWCFIPPAAMDKVTWGGGVWNSDEGGKWIHEYSVGRWYVGKSTLVVQPGEAPDKLQLQLCKLNGLVSLSEMGLTPTQIRQRYGQLASLLKGALATRFSSAVRSMVDLATSHVCFIVPQNEPLPDSIEEYARERQKTLIAITPQEFGTRESRDLERLQTLVRIDVWGKVGEDEMIKAKKRYEHMVSQYWW